MDSITTGQIRQLIERAAAGQIFSEDLNAFLEDPTRWRETPFGLVVPRDNLRVWMQDVYNEIEISCKVPLVPKLTPQQMKSLVKFGFRSFFIPAVSEDEYPSDFIKPEWGNRGLDADDTERKPLLGRWVAIETIDRDDYSNDLLRVKLKLKSRFSVEYDSDFYNDTGLLARAAKITGFPKNHVCLPTVEEWNFLGNMFNWLRENHREQLPDLGKPEYWEWCANISSEHHLITGDCDDGGLAGVRERWHDDHYGHVGFRFLIVL
ncbi:MAG: hypothetical protein PHD51_00235 [Patescibacteria group bacterium]|nr:hypothetical protein [Patescibacteria group bacterium]MDD5490703.1 hypothetical protein [Patescibacteria group bacterium]